MTFTSRDLRDQIVIATNASDGDYNVDAILAEILEQHGAVTVDSLDRDEFWTIVGKHAVDSLTVGDTVTIPDYAAPEDWSHTGEIIEISDETVVVHLTDGHRQELPTSEVTPA